MDKKEELTQILLDFIKNSTKEGATEKELEVLPQVAQVLTILLTDL